jgi:glycosyltransferase involved in cell wall biosynthesis
MTTVSIAIPAYNEEANLPELVDRLSAVFESLPEYEFEVVICENGSTDGSERFLRQVASRDSRFTIVQLIRNFHMEGGMIAALAHVSGDACIIMSADLQDPPELIPELIRRWEAGTDNVYTVISRRHGESIFRRLAANVFYFLLARVSDHEVPRNASDFRLVSRRAYEAFNSLPERVKVVRSTWAWLGFPSASVSYEREPRRAGKSSFKPFVTAPFAFRALLAGSFRILRAFSLLGFLLFAASISAAVGITLYVLLRGVPFPGFGTITVLILLLFSLLFLFLGVIAEYLSVVYEEVRQRPSFIVASVIAGRDSGSRGTGT